MKLIQTPVFKKRKECLDDEQLRALESSISILAKNPRLGKVRQQSLQDIWLYRFGKLNQSWLIGIAYTWTDQQLCLLALYLGKGVRAS